MSDIARVMSGFERVAAILRDCPPTVADALKAELARLQAERGELLAMLRRVVDAESVADYDRETDAAEALLAKYEAAGKSDAK